jgi:crotonobetaine/carnitine-CoA ligase
MAGITAIPPAQRTLPALLELMAARHGDRPLVRWADRSWSNRDCRDIAATHAASLKQAGIAAGDRVALICSNRPEFLQIYLGCLWLGAVIVPLNTASRGVQLQHMLSNSGARLLVIEAELMASLQTLDAFSLAVETIWSIGTPERADWAGRPIEMLPPPGPAIPTAAPRPGDLAAILYTSGTTGLSKGVCCPQAHIFWWGQNTARKLEIGPEDVLCTTLPLFHINAINAFYQALLTGASICYEPRFSASGFWRTMAERGATIVYLLGAMVPILLSRAPGPDEKAHKVRAALAPGVPERFHGPFAERTGVSVLMEGFGSTETNLVIGAGIGANRPGIMGPVSEGFEARVVDDEDNDLPDGTPGELIVRGDEPFSMASGYFGMPDKTVEAWRNLWFHTGDRVIRDADGSFRFVDRLKDAIRRRGENISSYEVEQVLLSHPAIASAAVFPVSSDLGEDEVGAAIVLKEGASLAGPTLMGFCEPLLAYFAIPRYVDFVAELPLTENGKVQKYKLRERGVTPTTWDREAAGYKLKR